MVGRARLDHGRRARRALIRSIVDTAVRSPERLVFEGPPRVVKPLAQDQEARAPIAHEGELIDTRAACPPLTAEEQARFDVMVKAAKAELKPEVEKSREKAAVELAAKVGIEIEQARATIRASVNGEATSWDRARVRRSGNRRRLDCRHSRRSRQLPRRDAERSDRGAENTARARPSSTPTAAAMFAFTRSRMVNATIGSATLPTTLR